MPSKLMLLHSQGTRRAFQKCLQKGQSKGSNQCAQPTALASATVTFKVMPQLRYPSLSYTLAQPPWGQELSLVRKGCNLPSSRHTGQDTGTGRSHPIAVPKELEHSRAMAGRGGPQYWGSQSHEIPTKKDHQE